MSGMLALVAVLVAWLVACGGATQCHLVRPAVTAPLVFVGRVRHSSAPLGPLFSVLVRPVRCLKGRRPCVSSAGAGGGRLVRLRFVAVEYRQFATAGRPCVAQARLHVGRRYVFYAAEPTAAATHGNAAGGDVRRRRRRPLNLSALAAPSNYNHRLVAAVGRAFCVRCDSRPSITQLEMRTVRDRLVLVCRARGSPVPRVRWIKDGTAVERQRWRSSGRLHITAKRKKRKIKSRLVIDKLSLSDIGSYKCRAANRIGRVSSSINVSIHDIDLEVTACQFSSYCMNGGSCFSYKTISHLACQCTKGFEGRRCERKTFPGIFYGGSGFASQGLAPPNDILIPFTR